MRRIGRRRLGAAIVGTTLVGLIASSATAGAVGPNAAPELDLNRPVPVQLTNAPQLAGGQVTAPLTLITGDQLHVGPDDAGEPVVTRITQAPREHGDTVAFYTLTRLGQSYVVPSDALPLLHDGVLDWELFNPAKLVAHVLAGTIDEVPVIVSHADRGGELATFDGATTNAELASINATSVTIDGDGRWWHRVQAGTAGDRASALRNPLAGVAKVWLNELARISLDESVPQIGAEVAWDAGYDGSGVTVAVLDTGIDADHPDVAGKVHEAVDFTDSPSGAADGHGHGTHVAATIAGTGDASAGQRPGVAPGADLIVGKVCNDGGSCPNDAIIAGMEWAAQSGADVVNMSLGGGPTDGTDPLSQAVNVLSQQYGTLYVIAAGNSGPGASTVAAPSVADEALSVAAIDKTDGMADFSSRGPRVGDGAMKPEIAAPGVDIVAARAAGTAMGTPVDDFYTTASGTSMATPHVAGAAAVVAEANPDLSGSELKALLMSTATDLGHDLDAQGMGRVDVGNAADPSIIAQGSLAFGRHAYPHSPITRSVTYTNVTDQAIPLSLAATLATADGTPAQEGMLSLGVDEVTVPAGGSVAVQVVLDGSLLGEDGTYGAYRGRVAATDDEGQLRATSIVSAVLEPEAHEVTIEIISPDGAQDASYGQLIVSPMGTDTSLYSDWITLPGGELSQTELFAGVYTVAGEVRWSDAAGEQHLAMPMELELVVDGPETVTWDLRGAKPVRAETPEPAEPFLADVALSRTSPGGEWAVNATLSSADGMTDNWWLLPTDPVTTGSFTYRGDFALLPPLVALRAIGGGPPIDLPARYSSYHSSVSGVEHYWQVSEDEVERVAYDHPVPRLDRVVPLRVVDGGSGTAADVAEVDVRGALVLIRPTDLCTTTCPFEDLQERVSAAADAGAVAVAVAGEEGRLTLPNPPTSSVECTDGPDSCPPVVTFADVPVVSVPADRAAALQDRLRGPAPVRVQERGTGQLSTVYALGFATDDRVPGDLPHRVRQGDLQPVEHRFHSDRPGEVTSFGFARVQLDSDEPAALRGLPRTPSQRSVEMLVGPAHDGIADVFQVRVDEWTGPLQLERFDVQDMAMAIIPAEEQALVLTGDDVLTWNAGVMVPAAYQSIASATSGEETLLANAPCAGCRDGDRFWPTMYLASSAGNVSQVIGVVNDTGLSAFMLGMTPCQPPYCAITMTDSSGAELGQTLLPVEIIIAESVSSPAGDAEDGQAALPDPDGPFGGINVHLERKEAHR